MLQIIGGGIAVCLFLIFCKNYAEVMIEEELNIKLYDLQSI